MIFGNRRGRLETFVLASILLGIGLFGVQLMGEGAVVHGQEPVATYTRPPLPSLTPTSPPVSPTPDVTASATSAPPSPATPTSAPAASSPPPIRLPESGGGARPWPGWLLAMAGVGGMVALIVQLRKRQKQE